MLRVLLYVLWKKVGAYMDLFSKTKSKEQPQQPKNWKQALFQDLDVIYVFVVFMLVYLLLFRVVVVTGSSMNQTLLDGDMLLLVSNTVYRDPHQGDIIVASKDSFRHGECIVKRVIATEGQVVDIDFENRLVYVDGQPLEESYAFFAVDDPRPMVQSGVIFPQTVPEGCVFVMGDNRNDSLDSRSPSIGFLDEREILGKAILLFFPGTDGGYVPRDYTRIGGLN